MRPRVALITTIVALLLLIPATASAALVDEQRQGESLIAQLAAGTKTCRALSANDLDHIGEYVMFRALGSTALHQAMNSNNGFSAQTRRTVTRGGVRSPSQASRLAPRWSVSSRSSRSSAAGPAGGRPPRRLPPEPSSRVVGQNAGSPVTSDGGLISHLGTRDW